MKYVLVLVVLMWLNSSVQAQNKHSEKDYTKKPVWINMMNDTSANYFEVEKAYTVYWQHHEMPMEDEFEVENGYGNEKDENAKEQLWKMNMALAVRKYKNWRMHMLNYVQPGGRILTPTEQITAWRIQQEQSKNQKNK